MPAATIHVHDIENNIQALYAIFFFTLPLLGAVFASLIALYFQLRKSVERNSATIGVIARTANGKLDQLQQQIGDIHAATTDGTTGSGSPAGQPPGGTADGVRGGDTPGVAPIQPIDVQPSS